MAKAFKAARSERAAIVGELRASNDALYRSAQRDTARTASFVDFHAERLAAERRWIDQQLDQFGVL
ncbi:hypothetical protein QCE62_07065 [Caballeronia sp. LZ033]|uniref:hypothetical protein n=1 Tax=Caballeronia sp. LZ033 TaxID=3038566 RepID=UPI00286035CD|nr:hypothetical protein [Caballeronia sp. LZ033]MDR5813352.1 hypothetical protein [Caballeronia sp. LZ033]